MGLIMQKIEAIRVYVIAAFLGVMGILSSIVFGSIILVLATVSATAAWASRVIAVRRHHSRR